MKVKLNNQVTCRLVSEITKDPEHRGKCPIIMDKEKWLLIKPSVMLRKKNVKSNEYEQVDDFLKKIFGKGFF